MSESYGGPLRVLLHILRAQASGDPYAFRFAPQDYILPTEGGDSPSARFEWTPELLGDLQAVRLPGRDPELVQRIGERLRGFLMSAGWEHHERAIARAAAEHRRIILTVRSSAAEMYALPWELLTLRSGQYVGGVEGLLLRYEWPESERVQEPPALRPEGGRILVAWSAAGGSVPADAHIRAIASACEAGFIPLIPDRDILPNASVELLVKTLKKAKEAGPPISALHLLCHGSEIKSTFGLCLSGRQGPVVVTAAELQQALAPFASMVRLVVLSACDSGNSGALGNRLGSVAQALHRCGFRSVVASRAPLSVDGANRMTLCLYSELLSESASLESALLTARDQLAQAETELPFEQRPLDWASVQLYARQADGDDTRPILIRPYRGLAAFQPEHRRFFFGRDREIEEIISDLQALRAQVGRTTARLLIVTGASGIGKSSLIMAGVIPTLRADDPELVTLFMRPGADPLRVLRETLSTRKDQDPVLLVVDQLEEIFTQTPSAAAREAFVQELWSLASAPQSSLCVILILRVDFIGRCGELTVNAQGLRLDRIAYDEAHRCFVVQPDPEQLRAAIVEPARKVGLELEAGLADRILVEVGKEPGAMPLLQDMLNALWKRREGRILTQAAYDALGGVVGALQNRADALLDTLAEPGELKVAQRLLLSLVAVSSDTALDTRLRMPIVELRAQAGELSSHFDRVLEELVGSGLLVQAEDGRGATAEIAHETLIRRWPRLLTWLAEDRAALVVQRRIRQAAKEWEQSRDESLLYRGTQLAWAAEWRKLWDTRIGELERQFLDASEALRLRLKQEAADQLRLEREAAERIRQLLLGSYVERGYKLLDSPTGAEESLLWLFRAYQQGSKEAILPHLLRRAMQPVDARRAVINRGENVLAAVLSPDDQRVVTLAEDGSAWISDVNSGQRLHDLGPAHRASFSPDGQRLLLCGDSALRISESGTGRILLEIAGSFPSASFSPDGRSIFAIDQERTFRSFDADVGRALPGTADDGNPYVMDYDPAGRLLLVYRDSESPIELRERGSGKAPIALAGSERTVSAVFSPNGQRIFTLSKDEIGTVFEVPSGQRLAQFQQVATTALLPTMFCPSASRIVLPGGASCLTRICDAASGAVLELLRGHSCDVQAASYSPSGRRIVSCSWDKTARIYDADLGAPISERQAASKTLRTISRDDQRRSPDGRFRLQQLVYLSLAVVDTASGESLASLSGHQGIITSAEFSPDGRRIVTTSEDATARLYETERFGSIAVLSGHRGAVFDAAFDATGRRVVTTCADGAARVFDTETGFLLSVHDVPVAQVNEAVFSADASSLITRCSDGMERVFDLKPETRSGEELGALIARRALLRFESESGRAPVPNLWQ